MVILHFTPHLASARHKLPTAPARQPSRLASLDKAILHTWTTSVQTYRSLHHLSGIVLCNNINSSPSYRPNLDSIETWQPSSSNTTIAFPLQQQHHHHHFSTPPQKAHTHTHTHTQQHRAPPPFLRLCIENMAEVLSRSSHDDQSYYSGSSLKRSAPSRTSLLVGSPPKTSSLQPAASEPSFEHLERFSRSLPSSTSLSTRQSCSDFSSFSSTPASTLSFESQSHEDDEEIAFPAYDAVQFFHEDEPLPPSPRPEDDEFQSETETQSQPSDASQELASTTDSTRSDSPLPTPTVADDTAIKHEPSRHVDYLSHDWREEDIWSSWRHIVSQRKVYGQRSRLENASWRTWAKSKYQLATVSPETLNWYALFAAISTTYLLTCKQAQGE